MSLITSIYPLVTLLSFFFLFPPKTHQVVPIGGGGNHMFSKLDTITVCDLLCSQIMYRDKVFHYMTHPKSVSRLCHCFVLLAMEVMVCFNLVSLTLYSCFPVNLFISKFPQSHIFSKP